MIIRNDTLRTLVEPRYDQGSLAKITNVLDAHQTLKFRQLSTGLFSAAQPNQLSARTGYKLAWVRDNVHIAHALWIDGQSSAVRTATALATFFSGQRSRFLKIIAEPSLASVPFNRPHVRFDGERLAEVNERWSHDQNDALGYFLWLYFNLASAEQLSPTETELETLALFPSYFKAIEYWHDADSGHWEEPPRKVAASSIGTVLAGLRTMRQWLSNHPPPAQPGKSRIAPESLDELIHRGQLALDDLLPSESRGSTNRPYDAALLFLIYPLRTIAGLQAKQIVANVIEHLQGEFGIKRYLGDSFYCTDYETNLRGLDLTKDFTEDIAFRDSFFIKGGEAQWCLFDPIVSIYFGLKFRQTGNDEDLLQQTNYLNRSLGQITGGPGERGLPFQCPELYYFEQGKLQTSRSTPLLWTQANVLLALQFMRENL